MTVPQSGTTKQVSSTITHTITLTLSTTAPANEDAVLPRAGTALCICPACGHAHGGYEPTASALLDCLAAIIETARAAQAMVEGEVGL